MTAATLPWRPDDRPRPALWLMVLMGSQIAALSFNFSKVGLTSEGGSDIGRLVVILPGQILFGTLLLAISPNVLRLLKRPEAATIFYWLAWGLLTLFWSIDPRQTTILIVGAMNLFVISLWLTYFFGESAYADISATATTVVVAGGVYWQWFSAEGPGFEQRFEGLSQSFNQQAAICAFGIIFTLVGLKASDRYRPLRVVAAIGLLAGLVATGGRVPLAATLVAATVLFRREVFDERYRRYVLPALAVVGAGVIMVLASVDIYQRSEENTALNGRDLVWGHSVDLILDAPIGGHGMMAGGALWQAAEQAGLVDFSAGGAHNTVLEVLVGGGVVGLAFYLLAMVVVVRSLIRSRSVSGQALMTLAVLLGVTESLVHRPTIVYWVLGAIAAITIKADSNANGVATAYGSLFTPEPIPMIGKAKVGRFG